MTKPNWIEDKEEWEADILIVKASGEMARTNYPGQYRKGPSKSGKPGMVGIYFHDFSGEPRPNRGKCEATRDPIFVLMRRTVCCGEPSCEEENPPIEKCHDCLDKIVTEEPEAVFISREEGEDYGQAHRHNLGEKCDTSSTMIGMPHPKNTGRGWYVYCIPAEGSLATLLAEHARRED